MTTATEAFGKDVVDALAMWAIDALCYPPVRIDTYTTRLPADEIRRGRAILESADIDWRAIKGGDVRSETAARRERGRAT